MVEQLAAPPDGVAENKLRAGRRRPTNLTNRRQVVQMRPVQRRSVRPWRAKKRAKPSSVPTKLW